MSLDTSNGIRLFHYAQQHQQQQEQFSHERSKKIQIPKIRGNLSSFNDLMSYDSMKQENEALNNLRYMSEDKLEQFLTNLNNNSSSTTAANNPNLGSGNNLSLNYGNSIMGNNLYYQNCTQSNSCLLNNNQPFSPERRKSSNIVGWDHDETAIQEQENEDCDLTTDKQNQNEGSTMLHSHSGSEKQGSSHSTAAPAPMPQLEQLKSLSKKSSCIQLMSSAADLSEQPTKQQSFSELNTTSPSAFFKKQGTISKLPLMRSQSPSIHSSSAQDKSIYTQISTIPNNERKAQKIIKIRTPSATPHDNNNNNPSSSEKNSEVSKNNSNNGQIGIGTNQQNNNNNTLYYKKILQNTKVLQQRQKALAQFQQIHQSQLQSQSSSSQQIQQPNLKSSQSSALYHISSINNTNNNNIISLAQLNQHQHNNSNSVHEKYYSPQRGSISKSIHTIPTSEYEIKIINPIPIDKQNQENDQHHFEHLDFGKIPHPKISYLNFSKGKRYSKYNSNTEHSQLKTETDNSVSPLTNDILSQSTQDFQGAATKYVNYTQKLYKNIQSSIDYLQKQFDHPSDKKQNMESSSPKEKPVPHSVHLHNQHLPNRLSQQQSIQQLQTLQQQPPHQQHQQLLPSQHQHNFIKQQYYTLVNKSQLQQVVYPQMGSSALMNGNPNSSIVEQPTYKNYQKLSLHKKQAKSVDRVNGQSSTISPNQPSPRREQQMYKTNVTVMNATSANILSNKIINIGGNNILSYCIKNKPLIRSSSQYQKRIDQMIKSHNDSNLSSTKPMIKPSDISASLQVQLQQAFMCNHGSSDKNENNNSISNNIRLELKPKNSLLKFDPIFAKKI